MISSRVVGGFGGRPGYLRNNKIAVCLYSFLQRLERQGECDGEKNACVRRSHTIVCVCSGVGVGRITEVGCRKVNG